MGERRAERKVGDVGDAVLRAVVEHRLVALVEQRERVLDTGQPDTLVRRPDLVQAGGGDADAEDLALIAQRGHLRQLVLHGCPVGFRQRARIVHQPQVDRAEVVGLESSQIVLDTLPQLGRLLGRHPSALRVADRADLGDDDQIVGIGMQRLVDQLVGHVRSVVLRGVDVVHAGLDHPSQHRDRLVVVAGRSRHTGTGELHGTETDPADGPAGDLVRRSRHVCRRYLGPPTGS